MEENKPVVEAAPPSPVDTPMGSMSVDDYMINMQAQTPTVAEAKVQDPNTMAHAISAASSGAITYEGAVNELMTTGFSSGAAIRNHAAALYVKDIEEQRVKFDQEASRGMLLEAENTARTIDALNRAKDDVPLAKAISRVYKEAAINAATSNTATIENNSSQRIYEVADQIGTDAAMKELVMQYLSQRGIAPTETDMMGFFTAAIGAPINLAILGMGAGLSGVGTAAGAAGLVLGTGMGLKFAKDSFVDITSAIEKVSGIKSSMFSYAEQIDKWKERLRNMPKEQAMTEFDKVAEEVTNRQTFGTGSFGKAMTMLNLMKLADKFDENEWKETMPSLSLKTQQWLDRAGLALDVIGVGQIVRGSFKYIKGVSTLAGGKAAGTQVGADIVNGKNTAGLTQTEQVGFGLSMDLSKYLPDGVVGTSAAVQQELKVSLQAALDKLNKRISIDGDAEAVAMRDYLVRNSDRYSANVVSTNMQSGEVLLQHGSGAPFRNVDNAKSFAARMEKETGLKWEVVPANDEAVKKASLEVSYDYSGSLNDTIEEARAFGDTLKADDIVRAVSADSKIIDLATGKEVDNSLAKEVGNFLKKGGVLKNVGVEIVDSAEEWGDIVRRTLAGTVDNTTLKKRIDGMKGLMGLYEPYTNKVYLMKNAATSPSLAVHELAHARLGGVIQTVIKGDAKALKAAGISNDQVAAVRNLTNIFKYVDKALERRWGDNWKDVRGTGMWYGMTNIHEFASEALSSKHFMEVLKDIKLPKEVIREFGINDIAYTGKVRTAWDAFVKTVSKVLGWNGGDDAFTQALDQLARLSNSISPEQQNMIRTLRKNGISDKQIKQMFAEPFAALAHGWYVRHAGSPMLHSVADIESRFGPGLDPIHRASELSVHERTVTLFGEQRDRNALKKFMDDGFKGLTRKEHSRVIKALEQGDETQQEWNVAQLVALGLDNNRMQKAYYTYRTLSNLDLHIKNVTLNENLTRRGFVQGYLKDGLVTHFAPAKNVPIAEAEGKTAYNLTTQKVERVDSTKHTGVSIVETAKAVSIAGQEYTRFIGDNATLRFGQLRPQIPNRKGSFRNYYSQDYFGQVNITRMVNGEAVDGVLHLRTSNSGADIRKWAAGMDKILAAHRTNPGSVTLTFIENNVGKWEDPQAIYDAIVRGEWDNYKGFGHHYDRANDQYIESLAKTQWDDDMAKMQGRGMRLKSIDADKDNIIDPIKAIEAELTNVARHRNIDQWRDKWVQTWWETFSDTIPEYMKRGKSRLQVMSNPELQVSVYTGSEKAAKFAESQRNYILSMLGAKTVDEKYIEEVTRRVLDGISADTTMFGVAIGEKVVTAGHAMRNADPLQFIRSFNFATMLAAFNPAQLFVQSAGAVNAIAVSPIHGLKAAYTVPLLRVALMSDNPAVWSKVATLENISKFGFSDVNEFNRTVAAIKKTGLLDGIVATSMHNAEAGRFNLFTGAVSKLGEKTAFFFNRGEEFTRLVAFEVAKREFIATHGVANWDTDAGLRAIIARGDDLTQNMTRSNLAFYQRGTLAIPGQFLQYNIKLATNIAGAAAAWGKSVKTGQAPVYRGYTASEAMRVFAAHTLLYGMAGNGLMMFADEVMGGYEKLVGREATDDERLTFAQGVVASMINEISQATTGEDTKLAIGSRLGTFEYYDKLARSIWEFDSSFWEVALGPSYGTVGRMSKAVEAIAAPFVRKDFTLEALGDALTGVGKETFSGWKAHSKAYYAHLHEGQLPDKEGTAMITMTKGEMIGQFFGIGPSVEQDYWRLRLGIKARREAVEEFAKSFLDTEKVALEVLKNEGDSVRYKQLSAYMSSLHSNLPSGERDFFFALITKDKGAAATAPFKDTQTKIRAEYLQGNWDVKDYLSTRRGALTDVKPPENK